MTPLAADGHVAELSLPPLLADALQRPVAAAVHTSGEEAAFGAVVTLVAHVTSVVDKKIVPSHQSSSPSTGTTSFVLTCNHPACRRTRTQGDSPACKWPWSNRCPATPNHSCTRTTCCRSRGGTLAMEHSSAETKVFFYEARPQTISANCTSPGMRGHSILPCSDTRSAWCKFPGPLRIPPGTAGLCSNCPGSVAIWTLARGVYLV